MSITIHQEITINASVQRVYEALTDAKQFAKLSGAKAQINPAAGGQFSCFDDMITGQTIEAMPGNRLVQAWRVGNWGPGIYSIVKFEFEKISDEKSKIIFDHTGYPQEHSEHLEQGWHNKYWQPLNNYFGG